MAIRIRQTDGRIQVKVKIILIQVIINNNN